MVSVGLEDKNSDGGGGNMLVAWFIETVSVEWVEGFSLTQARGRSGLWMEFRHVTRPMSLSAIISAFRLVPLN